ncbi:MULTISPECIES: hypothetical protein [unclassified Methylobacterium]|jgi:hypothetical protein|uniref:hypothetical protein n=1 Tax=unclassified Methylobacterium TaxID=2615210 RepID=UPI001352F3E9|nr:hypothetical protein [Methylobacterium sp. 2A]MWV22978.1 hypothetical protein [Methylobacterium sp. 2A]
MLDTLVALFPPGLRDALRAWATGRPAAGRARVGSPLLRGLDSTPAPMPVVTPPAATNDNPLRAVHEAVERDLRASGHLR